MGVTVLKKLTVNFMLNQLRQLKQSSSFLLTIKILPCRKDDLLYHFGQVIEALSPLMTLLPATAVTTSLNKQNAPTNVTCEGYKRVLHHGLGAA